MSPLRIQKRERKNHRGNIGTSSLQRLSHSVLLVVWIEVSDNRIFRKLLRLDITFLSMFLTLHSYGTGTPYTPMETHYWNLERAVLGIFGLPCFGPNQSLFSRESFALEIH
ncbi:Protein of unknown function [Gryllus bimaculatus]|nr:Protein of unknown function [Gryllus bimaculatus]